LCRYTVARVSQDNGVLQDVAVGLYKLKSFDP
jgi:hypothetical protein